MSNRAPGYQGMRAPRETTGPASKSDPGSRIPDPALSVIVPTYNERDSLPRLVSGLAEVGRGLAVEVIIVDDASPDGTGLVADEMAKSGPLPMTVVHRSGKAGLASAVLAGAAAARGRVVTVMDADLSHPPELVPSLVEAIRRGADISVASRYVPGGGVGQWPWSRRLVSRIATLTARIGLGLQVRDPLSGFFTVRREILTERGYLGLGYKLLVEILARHPQARVAEIPYRFVDRQAGHSKLKTGEIWAFLKLLAHLKVARIHRSNVETLKR